MITETELGRVDGKDDYEVAKDLGFEGTRDDWNNSLSELIDREIISVLNAHIQAYNNPHTCNKSTVDLLNISNYESTIDNNSTSNYKYSTPVSCKEEFTALSSAILALIQSNASKYNNTVSPTMSSINNNINTIRAELATVVSYESTGKNKLISTVVAKNPNISTPYSYQDIANGISGIDSKGIDSLGISYPLVCYENYGNYVQNDEYMTIILPYKHTGDVVSNIFFGFNQYRRDGSMSIAVDGTLSVSSNPSTMLGLQKPYNNYDINIFRSRFAEPYSINVNGGGNAYSNFIIIPILKNNS